jgi:hypothetical protein
MLEGCRKANNIMDELNEEEVDETEELKAFVEARECAIEFYF